MLLGAAAIQGSYTEGVLPIHINDLNCTGSEESVWECPHNGIAGYSCNHYQDASVICQEGKKILLPRALLPLQLNIYHNYIQLAVWY